MSEQKPEKDYSVAEIGHLLSIIHNVESLHTSSDGQWCDEDGFSWPCRTKRAITSSAEEARADAECGSCGEGLPTGECPKSKRSCGHHCNHIWTHDQCDWCGAIEEPLDLSSPPGEAASS